MIIHHADDSRSLKVLNTVCVFQSHADFPSQETQYSLPTLETPTFPFWGSNLLYYLSSPYEDYQKLFEVKQNREGEHKGRTFTHACNAFK